MCLTMNAPHNDSPARIIQLWMEISRLLRRSMSGAKSDHACMNPMQMHGMMLLSEHPEITMTEFAKLLHVSSPSATSFVDRLVKLRWVERVPDADNRKLIHLRLLPAGRASLEEAMKAHSAVMHDLFSLLAPDDQRQLEGVLARLKEALARNVSSR